MEFVLCNTDIFDEEIGAKFNQILKSNKDSFVENRAYTLTVSFHVNLLNDARFTEFNVPASKISKGTREDKISDVMSFQLKTLEKILSENGVEVFSTTIQGDDLESENIIKLEISEYTSEPVFTGRGKNKKRMKGSSIIPNLPKTMERVNKIASEILSKRFYNLMNIIRNKKFMSEILEIEETEDEDKLFAAFVKHYGELWLATDERHKELVSQLQDRCLVVLNKYVEKENKA